MLLFAIGTKEVCFGKMLHLLEFYWLYDIIMYFGFPFFFFNISMFYFRVLGIWYDENKVHDYQEADTRDCVL